MQSDFDLALALSLQEEFEQEAKAEQISRECNRNGPAVIPKMDSSSIVDETWELNDPNPNIHNLFLTFNDAYFWKQLTGIEVKWSPKMTLCAGICHYEGRGGLCSVRLSLPLLKLRPRKDLVQTLLHEMIHAYLFVTNNNKDHDAHGPEFHKHMNRINKIAGTHITVYHTFHDEVALYKQHWWRCNGPCQTKRPFFGYVKRSMNRAPSANDRWWDEHKSNCNGIFLKVKEPENYGKTGKRKPSESSETKTKKPKGGSDIRNFFTSNEASSSKAADNTNEPLDDSITELYFSGASTQKGSSPKKHSDWTLGNENNSGAVNRPLPSNPQRKVSNIVNPFSSPTTSKTNGTRMNSSNTVTINKNLTKTKNRDATSQVGNNIHGFNNDSKSKLKDSIFKAFGGKGHVLGNN